jgi:D-cysteine desulfhydrase
VRNEKWETRSVEEAGSCAGPLNSLPHRVFLGQYPTRIRPLPHLGARLAGPSLYVKQDDETGSILSGNKVRKLEFLLAEAQEKGSDLVVTCGAVASNHCRATAAAARRLGIDSLLFLRGEDPGARDGNLLLDAMLGAELRFITPEAYARRGDIMAAAADDARARGRRPYVIPEGGSNARGALGYVACVDEIAAQSDPDEPFPWDHLVAAVGSGGTLAGLLMGVKRRGLPLTVWGVNVCDSAAYFTARVLEIAGEFAAQFPGLAVTFPPLTEADVRILEGYQEPGYGRATPETMELVRETARTEGLFLDPVYTGKAMHGLVTEARRGRFGSDGRVLFLHTGGIFSLFPFRAELLRPAG